jgi:hypothetical protein
MALVTLEQAKRQVLIPTASTARDAEVQEVVDRASAVIVDYLKAKADPAWTPETAPLVVQQATLLLVGYYWVHRGDDWDQATDDELWAGLERLLARHRVPSLA